MVWVLFLTMIFQVASFFWGALGSTQHTQPFAHSRSTEAGILTVLPSSTPEVFPIRSFPEQLLRIFWAIVTLIGDWICICILLWELPFIPVFQVVSAIVMEIGSRSEYARILSRFVMRIGQTAPKELKDGSSAVGEVNVSNTVEDNIDEGREHDCGDKVNDAARSMGNKMPAPEARVIIVGVPEKEESDGAAAGAPGLPVLEAGEEVDAASAATTTDGEVMDIGEAGEDTFEVGEAVAGEGCEVEEAAGVRTGTPAAAKEPCVALEGTGGAIEKESMPAKADGTIVGAESADEDVLEVDRVVEGDARNVEGAPDRATSIATVRVSAAGPAALQAPGDTGEDAEEAIEAAGAPTTARGAIVGVGDADVKAFQVGEAAESFKTEGAAGHFLDLKTGNVTMAGPVTDEEMLTPKTRTKMRWKTNLQQN